MKLVQLKYSDDYFQLIKDAAKDRDLSVAKYCRVAIREKLASDGTNSSLLVE